MPPDPVAAFCDRWGLHAAEQRAALREVVRDAVREATADLVEKLAAREMNVALAEPVYA
jgi:hypothetical protein